MTGPTDPPPRAPLWGLPEPASPTPARPLLWDDDLPVETPPAVTAPAGSPAAAAPPPPVPPAAPPPGPRPVLQAGMDRRVLMAIGAVALVAVSTVVVVAVKPHPAKTPVAAPVDYSVPTPAYDPVQTSEDLYSTESSEPTDSYPTEDPTTEAPTGTATDVPAGYRIESGPAGVQVPLPVDWSVRTGAVPSNLQADDPSVPGRFVRFGGDPADGTDPVSIVEGYERDTPSIRRGYQRLRLEPVSFGASSSAADWEFTFLKDGRTRHAYGRYWYRSGTLYVVYLSAYETDWSSSTDVLQTVLTYSSAP